MLLRHSRDELLEKQRRNWQLSKLTCNAKTSDDFECLHFIG